MTDMKSSLNLLILGFAIFIFTAASGCSDYQKGWDPEEKIEAGFDQDSMYVPGKQHTVKDSPVVGTSRESLAAEISEFKAFSEEFFAIWAGHIDETSGILDSFNDNNISIEEKTGYAVLLAERYKDFRTGLLTLNPPGTALKAYSKALEAISYRILFFEGYIKNIDIEELNHLENMAYILEAEFWEEMDKIYKYFEEKAGEKPDKEDEIIAWGEVYL